MLRCSVLGDPSARLGCFDALTKAATAETVAGTPIADPTVAAAPAAADAKPIPAVASASKAPPETPISRMQQLWELTPSARRGIYTVRPHRDNYLLVGNYSSASNEEPYREFTPVGSSRVDLQACKLEYSIVSPK